MKEQFKKLLLDAQAIAAKAEEEGRDLTSDERQNVANLLEEAGKLKAAIKAAEGDQALRDQIKALGEDFDLAAEKEPKVLVPGGKGGTLGEQFLASAQWKGWLERMAPNGHIPESVKHFNSPAVEFKTLITGDSDTSAGAFVTTDNTGIYEPLGRKPLVLRDLVARRTTTSDTVEFVRQTAQVQQAAPVAEANVTDYAGETGEVSGEKPEAAMAFEKVTATVKTIAVWIPATKRALSDAAQIRGIIDQELRADLEEELESRILGGNGTGEDFTGLLNTSNVLSQAWDTDMLTTMRKAITAVRVTGKSRPSAWLMHPNDIEALDLLKDGDNRFYWGGPAIGGVPQVWRVPVVECQTMTEGVALLGDFRKAVLWDREQASLQVSDSHSDFFIRNMVAFLAEMRAAFGVIRPSAFCLVDLTSGS